MKLSLVWKKIISKRRFKRSGWEDILLNTGRLAEEMNLRLLLQQELYGDVLYVEEIEVTGRKI